MLFLIGTFGLNFPIFISTMAVTVFHGGAGHYGLLTSTMAVGSVTGALLSARRAPRVCCCCLACALFGGLRVAAADAELLAVRRPVFVLVEFRRRPSTTANSIVQLSTDPLMRGRVMAILLAIALGGTPIGAPIVGWVADLGPRWALAVGASAGLLAALVGIRYLVRYRNLRIRFGNGRIRLALDESGPAPPPA